MTEDLPQYGVRLSRFKGVNWEKRRNKWRAQLRRKDLGYFADEEDAARKYDEEATKLGLAVNFPTEGTFESNQCDKRIAF